MKIIEGLKKIKDLQSKIKDLKQKIGLCCADTELDTPLYKDQKKKVSEWLQSIHDLLLELETLRFRIQKTNLNTQVEIELGNKIISKSITQWIMRRTLYAKEEQQAWSCLTDRGLQNQQSRSSNTTEIIIYKVRRYFDPEEKDKKIALYSSEPLIIDGKLEIINAITDLLE